MGMRVMLNEVVVAYAQGLFEARAGEDGGEPKYSAAFLFKSTHPARKALAAAIKAVAVEEWKDKSDEVLKQLKAADRLPVHSGDAKPDSAGYAGNLYVNASSKVRPRVMDTDPEVILASQDGRPYSGSIVNALVEVWAQNNKFGKRINASLSGVQFVRDGDRLSGGAPATASDFTKIAPAGVKPGGDGPKEEDDAADLFA